MKISPFKSLKWWQKIRRIVVLLILFSFTLTLFYRFVPVYFTPLMLTRNIERKMEGKDFKTEKDWESLENIDPNLVKAVIASEDQKFINHNGFDFDAMYQAFKDNSKGKKKKGGSTISQQVAKNVFLWQGRSYFRKILEAYFTVLIELLWSKERIMEVYLNCIEMGQGVYGAEAASQYYFDHSAKTLSRGEAAWIAAILPAPLRYNPKQPSLYLIKRHSHVLRQMRYVGTITF